MQAWVSGGSQVASTAASTAAQAMCTSPPPVVVRFDMPYSAAACSNCQQQKWQARLPASVHGCECGVLGADCKVKARKCRPACRRCRPVCSLFRAPWAPVTPRKDALRDRALGSARVATCFISTSHRQHRAQCTDHTASAREARSSQGHVGVQHRRPSDAPSDSTCWRCGTFWRLAPGLCTASRPPCWGTGAAPSSIQY